MKASCFVETTAQLALSHPFISPEKNDYPGILLGINVRSRKLVFFDPWLLRKLGIAHSTYACTMGPKGGGKSGLQKMVSMRLMTLSAGYETLRVMINDYKPEDKESEYAAMTRLCRSTVFSMRDMSINPFEPRLFLDPRNEDQVYEFGILQMAKIICEFEKEAELSPSEHYALRVAVAHMLANYHMTQWSPDLLERIAGSLTIEMRDHYQAALDEKLRKNSEARLKLVEDPAVKQQIAAGLNELTGTAWNYTLSEIVDAGKQIAAMLGKALHGAYAAMFGATHSLYDTLTQRAITKDWRGMDPRAESLMRIIDTTIRVSAVELNRTDLLPHIELDDEKHRSMDNLSYARTHSFFSEIARGVHTFNIGGTHTFDSIRKGAVGSELYNLGERIINNMAYVFYGRQPNNPRILEEIRRREGLSASDTNMLAHLPKYTFGVKFGETEPMRFIRVIATPMDVRDLIQSDSAAERMLTRPNIFMPDDLARYARLNGIEYVGG